MEIRVLNQSLIAVGIIDSVESIIITERYDEPGDFEIYAKYDPYIYNLLAKDYYLIIPDTDKVMIIESKEIKVEPELGARIVISGRSFESVIDRRIILKQIIINGSLQAGIHQLLNENLVACEFPQRNIPNLTLVTSVDPLITALGLVAQFYTENVLDVLQAVCRQSKIGFKITLNSSNVFEFKLYAGADRSYGQLSNPFVVFSSKFDNLISSNYYESKRSKRNWAFIAGLEGKANWNQSFYGRWAQVGTFDYDGGEGMGLREIFVDGSTMPTIDYNTSTPLPDAEYVAQLEQLGYQELAQTTEISAFSAEVDVTKQYTYKEDFNLGDIVQYIDDYGHAASARIVAMTISENLNGRNIYPTLKSL